MYRGLKKTIVRIENLFTIVTSVLLLAMTLLICGDAFGRYLLNSPIGITYELTELFFMIGIVYLGTSFTFREGGHVKIEFLEKRFTPAIQLVVQMLTSLLAAVFVGLLAYLACTEMIHTFRLKQVSPGMLEFPLWYSYLLMFLGVLLLCLRLLAESADALIRLFPKN